VNQRLPSGAATMQLGRDDGVRIGYSMMVGEEADFASARCFSDRAKKQDDDCSVVHLLPPKHRCRLLEGNFLDPLDTEVSSARPTAFATSMRQSSILRETRVCDSRECYANLSLMSAIDGCHCVVLPRRFRLRNPCEFKRYNTYP
jgi:hypothetical protein